MTRTILIHLNVELANDDPRDADAIATWIEQALETGLPGGRVRTAPSQVHGEQPAHPHMVVIALAEEI